MIAEETMRRLINSYDIGHLFDSGEFKSDADRIVLVAKLIDKWIKNKETNYRLICNHIIIINNVFGETGLYALYEYMNNFQPNVPALLSILYFLNYITTPPIYDEELYEALKNEN